MSWCPGSLVCQITGPIMHGLLLVPLEELSVRGTRPFSRSPHRSNICIYREDTWHARNRPEKEFDTVIEGDDDANVDSENELSLTQKLRLAITKKVSANQKENHT
ncbi:hypothetical protein TNCV_2932751 [Trichonephila clavipes]|nr:hypothetical protein TNCV_2932751 [Trichonephila clavipes]